MYYVCIENNQVTGILSYVPSVPSSITVLEIGDDEYKQIVSGKKKFDENVQAFVEVEPEKTDWQIEHEKKQFLANSDWIVLRHMREKTLGLNTSISEEEFLALESKRQEVAKSI